MKAGAPDQVKNATKEESVVLGGSRRSRTRSTVLGVADTREGR